MEDNKEATNTSTPNEPAQPISQEQAAEVAGGDGSCTTLGPISGPGTPTDIYDSLVDATSHVIERVVKSF